jgi:Beta-propeller repeat
VMRWAAGTTSFLLSLLLIEVVALSQPSSSAKKPNNLSSVGEVIAPSLVFSTYIGGSRQDSIRDVATDDQGNIYITGGTESADFPITPGAYDTTFNGWHDVYVMKLDGEGRLLWSTFLGGPHYDRAYAIEVDTQGYVYVAGRAGPGFPTTLGVIQQKFGDDAKPSRAYGPQDGFVTKLSPDGSQVIWSTYFGSNDDEIIRDIALDSSGNVYLAVTGVAVAHPHITSSSFQPDLKGDRDGVIAKLSADGARVIYASYIGGSGEDGETPSIRVDSTGYAYYLMGTKSADTQVTSNAFQKKYRGNGDLLLARIAPDGRKLVYSTYFGGSGIEWTETHGLSIDRFGNAYITASTTSRDLPVTASSFQTKFAGGSGKWGGDGFVAKLSLDGSQLLAGTYLGGLGNEGVEGSGVDNFGNVYIGGQTNSKNFPVTNDAFQLKSGGKQDCYVAKLSADLSELLYSTYLGGSDQDGSRSTAVDAAGNVVIAGWTKSDNFPTFKSFQRSRAGDWDLALAKFYRSQNR